MRYFPLTTVMKLRELGHEVGGLGAEWGPVTNYPVSSFGCQIRGFPPPLDHDAPVFGIEGDDHPLAVDGFARGLKEGRV
jgi:hypothetical protein